MPPPRGKGRFGKDKKPKRNTQSLLFRRNLGTTVYYMVMNQTWLRGVFGVSSPVDLWFGIQPISAGLFGVPVGFAVIILVSLFTPAPNKKVQELIEHVRYPNLKGDTMRTLGA